MVVGGDVSGNVLTNDGFGADGPGRIASIEINGVTYSFDGSDITYDDGSPQTISGSLLPNVPTQIGGALTFDFATGAWSFTAPTEVASDITGTFNYVIVDRDGDADTASLSIEVQAGNDAPVNTVPASIAVNEDTATKLTGISFADPDIGAGTLTVTLSVPTGALSATSAGGVTVGGTSAALTLTGTVANINAFIANAAQGVTYTPVANSTTDVTLTVVSNDNGHTGPGGALSDTDTVTLDLVPQNDAPTATITPTSYNVTEQTNLKLHGTGLSIADIDAGSNAISITLSVTQGILTVVAGNSGVTDHRQRHLVCDGHRHPDRDQQSPAGRRDRHHRLQRQPRQSGRRDADPAGQRQRQFGRRRRPDRERHRDHQHRPRQRRARD